jgi:hypothetical protein
MLNNHRDLKWQEDEQYQIFNRLLNITLDSQLYRPMDQRTFIEYVMDIYIRTFWDQLPPTKVGGL